LREILFSHGMAATVIANGAYLATNDLIVVFPPALAASQGIDAGTVGLLLSLRAAASMGSRLFFSQLVLRVGRVTLMTTAIISAGLASSVLAVTLPVWALALAPAAALAWEAKLLTRGGKPWRRT
jgi:MFS family permease